LLDPGDHAVGWVVRGRQGLAEPQGAGLDVLEHEVRERAADVDAEAIARHHFTSIRNTLRMISSIGQSVRMPSTPMITIRAMMSSVVSVSRDCNRVAPRPVFTPVNSPSTM